MKKAILTVAATLLISTNIQAIQYSDTGYEQVAEDTVIFNMVNREAATANLRTVCDTIFGADAASCSVRVYDGRTGDGFEHLLSVSELLCTKIECEIRAGE